ncbi:hypothetical protein SAMN05444166_2010 [Singulisphaera sp. GP187]|nr:hypothetical protein SAMN05444166_2010 [Singulisphaera sp. GP187]
MDDVAAVDDRGGDQREVSNIRPLSLSSKRLLACHPGQASQSFRHTGEPSETATGFTPISEEEYKAKIQSGSISGPTPSWWNPLKDAPKIFRHSRSFHPTFSHREAIAAYDPKIQIVNFYWDGID